MTRDDFLDWAKPMLETQLAGATVNREGNNVQAAFHADVRVGIVANKSPPEFRVHLYSYDDGRRLSWQAAGPYPLAMPGALPLTHRSGPTGNVSYLEFSSPVSSETDFDRWRPVAFGYVAFFIFARSRGVIP
jgi:hypothetical protein